MKSKKLLLIGLFMASIAASGIAAYQHCNGSTGTECCFPGCCADGQTTSCCETGN